MRARAKAENSQSSARKPRGRGRPFQAGQSGNPGGRPKELDEVKTLARAHTPDAINRLAFWMASENAKASVSACVALLDRAWGKSPQAITDGDGKPIIPPGGFMFVINELPGAVNRS